MKKIISWFEKNNIRLLHINIGYWGFWGITILGYNQTQEIISALFQIGYNNHGSNFVICILFFRIQLHRKWTPEDRIINIDWFNKEILSDLK